AKRRGPDVLLSDAQLEQRRNSLVQLFEHNWGEIGWELQRVKKPEELIPLFTIHPNDWMGDALTIFLRPAPAKLVSPRKLRSELIRICKLREQADKELQDAQQHWRALQQHTSGLDRKAQRLLRKEEQLANHRYGRATQDYSDAQRDERRTRERLNAAESSFARNEILNFLKSKRYEVNPLNLANAT